MSAGQGAYDDNVGTTLLRGPERTFFGKPVTMGVISDPIEDCLLFVGSDALVGVANPLENIVNILGDPEDTRTRLGN